MIFTMKIWSKYLLGDREEIYTDHKNLKYFFHPEGAQHETEEIT